MIRAAPAEAAETDFPEAAQIRVIAVNDAYRLAPWADVCYFADSGWWNWHRERPEFVAFAGERCSIQNSGGNIEDSAVHIMRNQNFPMNLTGLSLDPECLVTGSNSGWQALNLAILAGASKVLLLGYDGGHEHWFGSHPAPTPESVGPVTRKSFKDGAPAIRKAGVRVINCSPASAIDAFEKMPLEEALNMEGNVV